MSTPDSTTDPPVEIIVKESQPKFISGFQMFYIPIIVLAVLIIAFVAWKIYNRKRGSADITIEPVFGSSTYDLGYQSPRGVVQAFSGRRRS
jgi:hypothetical protein